MSVNLPPDIVADVLSRLSVKDLLRYRSVAKPWCLLIDGPEFSKKHLERAMKSTSGVGVVIRDIDLWWIHLNRPNVAKKLDKPVEEYGTELVGSCNGLLALFDGYDDVTIWNPSARRYRRIPRSEIEYPPGLDYFSVQFKVFGFGYDRIADDYNLVRMIQFHDRGHTYNSEVKVYSAKTDTWKRIRDFPYFLCYNRGYGVLTNYALHWVVSRTPESFHTKFIAALDLEKEEYREVPLPSFGDQKIHLNVEVFEGMLCAVCNFIADDSNAGGDSKSKGVDVWVMRQYGVVESWTKLCSVVPGEENGPFSYVTPVANMKAFGDDRILLDKSGKKFVTYDLKEEKIHDAKIFSSKIMIMEWIVCVESLVRLDDGGEGRSGWIRAERKKKSNKKMKRNSRKRKKNKKKDEHKSDDFGAII